MPVAAFRNELKYQVVVFPVAYILKIFFYRRAASSERTSYWIPYEYMLCASIAETGIKRKDLYTTNVAKLHTLKFFPALLLISLDADPPGEIDWEREETICDTERGSDSQVSKKGRYLVEGATQTCTVLSQLPEAM
jgi:hypothetical protein